MQEALEWLERNPNENAIAASRIFGVNYNTLKSTLQRSNNLPKQNGGQNKVLSQAQLNAVYKYVEDLYLEGYGASKMSVYTAICYMKAHEIPPKEAPSWRWFQTFMKANKSLFHTIKTKPIARVRVTSADKEIVEKWFQTFQSWCEEHNISTHQVYNFDEAGFRVGMSPGEEVVVPTHIKEVRKDLGFISSIY